LQVAFHSRGDRPILNDSFCEAHEGVLVVMDPDFACGLAEVTVDASNVALRDLVLDNSPGVTPRDQVRNVRSLVAQVIKLEDNWVGLPTVDAGMLSKVLPSANAVLALDSPIPFARTRH
jgi:hypothetical protein